jgi:hypothetical protein
LREKITLMQNTFLIFTKPEHGKILKTGKLALLLGKKIKINLQIITIKTKHRGYQNGSV